VGALSYQGGLFVSTLLHDFLQGDSMMYHNTANSNGNCSGAGQGSSPNSTPPNINACSSTTPPLSSGQTSDGNGKFGEEMVSGSVWGLRLSASSKFPFVLERQPPAVCEQSKPGDWKWGKTFHPTPVRSSKCYLKTSDLLFRVRTSGIETV
jgi:hypothetical protein